MLLFHSAQARMATRISMMKTGRSAPVALPAISELPRYLGQFGMRPDAIDLTGNNPPLARVKAELDGGRASVDHADQRLLSCCVHAQTRLTSTCVSLKQAPSARSALRSDETSAEIVCPVRLVASHAPFSLATTPGGTSAVTESGRMTSPRSFHRRTSMP